MQAYNSSDDDVPLGEIKKFGVLSQINQRAKIVTVITPRRAAQQKKKSARKRKPVSYAENSSSDEEAAPAKRCEIKALMTLLPR